MTTSAINPQSCDADGARGRFVCFMRGARGRAVRAVLGLVLIAVGLLAIGGTGGTAVAVFGLVPIASGATGICPLGPLFGTDFRGNIRAGSS